VRTVPSVPDAQIVFVKEVENVLFLIAASLHQEASA
jgi:hypothetical protein